MGPGHLEYNNIGGIGARAPRIQKYRRYRSLGTKNKMV